MATYKLSGRQDDLDSICESSPPAASSTADMRHVLRPGPGVGVVHVPDRLRPRPFDMPSSSTLPTTTPLRSSASICSWATRGPPAGLALARLVHGGRLMLLLKNRFEIRVCC